MLRENLVCGIAAVLPNYRLTPDHPYPAQEEDVMSVLRWVAAQADTFGFDLNRLGLAGSSAGAHLAALVGLKATRDGRIPGRLRGILAVCGVYDVARWVRDVPAMREFAEPFAGAPLEAHADTLRDASPVAHVYAWAPLVRCVHGARDETVPANQSELLVAALREAGAAAELQITPADGHSMTVGGAGVEPLGGRAAFVDFFTLTLLSDA